MAIKVAAFSESLRKESFTTKLVKAFQTLLPEGVSTEIIDVSKLPLMNEDMESNLPRTVKNVHTAIEKADAILLPRLNATAPTPPL